MQFKLLSSQAIIPEELYVERNADRQLAQAIQSLGRPPYVLVARQMGKTNLLLHAKKRLQTEQDVFCYIDLTKKFPNLANFFEFVVDRILDSSEALRAASSKEIARLRADSTSELAAVTYEKCLLAVLAHIPGKLVVIFDEVDSLATCPFSDRIFSQIRSVYFERGNESLSAFRRLTYVLSGVAEPRELIKDRSISPFNIGDKIVLDDFSFEEVIEFVSRANLFLPEELIKRIYSHTLGNPRMVWDVCSQVEDMFVQEVEPSLTDVDEIIERLYFNDIPSPPIDHIRSLVTDDRDLRAAVTALHAGEFAKIGDVIRSRMYLAGIARSVAGGTAVEWRNSIVKRSLSPDWLATLADASLDALVRFERAYSTSDHAEAERIYSLELDIGSVPSAVRHSYIVKYAHSVAGLLRFEEAINIANDLDEDSSCPYAMRMNAIFLRATCLAELDRNEEALADFTRVASSDGDIEQRAYAKYRLASTLLRLRARGTAEGGARGALTGVISALQETINFVDEKSDVLSPKTTADVLGPTTLALAQLLRVMRSDEEATTLLRRGFVEAHDVLKPKIAQEMLGFVSNDEERKALIETVCRPLMVDESLRPNVSAAKVAGFERATIVSLGAWAYALGLTAQYQALLQHALRAEIVSHDSLDELKIEIWEAGPEKVNPNVSVLREIVDRRASVDDEIVGLALAHIVRLQPQATEYLAVFLTRIERRTEEQNLTEDDFTAMVELLRAGLAGRQLGFVRRLMRSLGQVTQHKPYQQLLVFWLVIYFAARFCWVINMGEGAQPFAKLVLDAAPREILQQGFGKAGADDVLRQLREIVASERQHRRNLSPRKKIGRNAIVRVKYTDGRVVSAKFKHLETDIRQNKCVIVL